MVFRRWVAALDLIGVLAIAVVIELALNRLAVPALRPGIDVRPVPSWHRNLDVVGLFTFHLATLLALGVGIFQIAVATARRDLFITPARLGIATVASVFYGLAAWAVLFRAPGSLSFHLETALVVLLLLTWVAFALTRGDVMVKVGLLVLIVPFALHYYAEVALRFMMSASDAQISSLPDHFRIYGQWAIALAAIVVQVCFAPKPWQRYAIRPGPMLVAGFVGTIAAVILRRHQDVGIELAANGLGIELGPAAPLSMVAAYVLAAAATTWTLASTLTSDSPARRRIGVGFALIACGGYAFDWAVQFMSVFVGFFAIAEAGTRVVDEERALASQAVTTARTGPAIAESTWRAYVDALARALGASDTRVTVRGPVEETILGGIRGPRPFIVMINRAVHGVLSVDIVFGAEPDREPDTTLLSREGGVLGTSHPAPPPTSAPVTRTGDAAFDARFRVQGPADFLDDALRARAAAVLDGWLAVWRGQAVRHRVMPGRGAPLDSPIPLPALATGLHTPEGATERILRLFDLVEEIAEKTLPKAT